MLSYRIKSFREYADYTPEEVANHLGISVEEYLEFELGTLTPTIDQLQALAEFYKSTVSDITGNAPLVKLHDPEFEKALKKRKLEKDIKLSDLSWDEKLLIKKYRSVNNRAGFMTDLDKLLDIHGTVNDNNVDSSDDFDD